MECNRAKLVSYSRPVADNADNQDLTLLQQVAFCARVSNPANQQNYQTAEKLCRYLLKNHHYSPFEMVNICVEIETTRDISRQILRHRSFTFQEFSQRYAEVTDFTLRECRFQHPANRQMSVSLNENDEIDKIIESDFIACQKEIIAAEKKYYDFCIANNVAKEQARCLLSEGLTNTRLYMNGTLRSWIHYIQIRTDANTTQKEHCDVAHKIAAEIEKVFPLIREFVWKAEEPARVTALVSAEKATVVWIQEIWKMVGSFFDVFWPKL
jgi:thymidylate synthase (FAD)